MLTIKGNRLTEHIRSIANNTVTLVAIRKVVYYLQVISEDIGR